MREFDPNRTPGTIIGAVAAGTVVVPFLMVYAFLFIARGAFVNVGEPDITSSRTGETMSGLVALLFLALVLIGMARLLNGSGRWLFLLGQLITLATSVDFVLDSSRGEPQVPAVVLLGSLVAIVLALVRTSWAWVQTRAGTRPAVASEADGTAAPGSTAGPKATEQDAGAS